MLDTIVKYAPFYLLIAARCFALVMTLPLFSTKAVPRMAKVAFAGYLAYLIVPAVNFDSYNAIIQVNQSFSVEYMFLIAGEAFIGIITGFFISIIFASFSTAGQFFAFQMGFSASEVYDALSQVENPLMGQFFNLIAMLIFLQNKWAIMLFSKGVINSFYSVNAISLISNRENFVMFFLHGLTQLFADAFIIALPVMGVLVLISITMGILSKAYPQMNLLSEGFPIMILTSFFIILALIPNIIEFFEHSFTAGFNRLFTFYLGFVKTGGLV